MSNKLTPHVPRWLLRRLADSPSAAAPGQVYDFDAAALVLDIVGFTSLTEKLASRGSRGVEVLERILETVFGTLVGTVLAFGGDVTHFGGDAITCLWSVDENGDRRQALLRACAAALSIRAVMRRLNRVETPTGTELLAVRLGLGYGPATAFILGSDSQRLWTVAGPALDGAIKAETAAQPNHVQLSPEAQEILAPFISIGGEGDLLSLNALVRPAPPSLPIVDDALVQPFLHPVLVGRQLAPSSEFTSEFRPVVPLFVKCDPPASCDNTGPVNNPCFGEWLNGWVQAAQEIVNRFGGWLSAVEIGDKGNVLVIQFGTLVAHEDDEARAIGCALSLLDTARAMFPDMALHVGITKGRLFSGFVGGPGRHAYALVGDEMNLAARLMMLAEAEQVLVSGRVRTAVGEEFTFKDRGLVQVRGKQQAVPVFSVQFARREQQRFLDRTIIGRELVGREQELSLAEEVMRQTLEGHVRVLTISGEAGIGKSHLASTLLDRWLELDGVVLGGDCHPFASDTPYLPWRWIVDGAVRMLQDEAPPKNHIPEGQLESIGQVLANLPSPHASQDTGYWKRRLPLLAEVLGWEVEDNDLTRSLTGEARRDNTFATVHALLRAVADRAPVMVFVEDAHWADDLSIQLLAFVAESSHDIPLLILLTHRPLARPLSAPWETINRLAESNTIVLRELTEEASRRLIQNSLDGAQVPDALASVVFDKAHGHPFFTEEVVRMFRDVGCISLEESWGSLRVLFDPEMAAVASLPDTVQGVVQARVDKMDEEDRLTVKVASVIGRQFTYRVLEGIYPVPIDDDELVSHLRTAERLGLMLLERVSPELEYVFKHSITQEVVYQGLTFAQRRRLHAAVASWYEQQYAGKLEPYYPLLAYHYGRAGRREAELHYLLLAAEHATHIHAVADAARYYERALELLDEESEPARTAYVLIQLARGLHYTAQYERAQEYFRRALELYEQLDDPIHAAEACFEVSNRLEVRNLDEALKYVLRGLDYVRDRPDARHQFILGTADLAHIYRSMGRHQEANDLLRRALQLAEETNDLYGLWKCYRSLSIYHYNRGERREAFECGKKVIRYAELADAPVQHRIIALNNQACFAHELGDVQAAIEAGEAGLALARRSGVISEQVILASTLAGIYNHIGDWDKAERVLEEGFRLLKQHYHPYHEVALNIEAGDTSRGRGDWQKAVELWTQAEEKSRIGTTQIFTAELRARLAEGWVHLGDLEQARRWADAAESLAREMDQRGVLVSIYRARGLIAREQGDLETGKKEFERALALARELDDPIETARVLSEYGRILVELGRFNEGMARLREAEEAAQRAGLYHVAQVARERIRSLSLLPL